MKKYRVFCITEGTTVETWSTSPPSVCPHDVGHDINPDSVFESPFQEESHNIAESSDLTTYRTIYQTVKSQPLEAFQCIYSVSNGTAILRLFDVTNVAVISESEVLSGVNPTILPLTNLTYLGGTNPTIIEVQIKKLTGTGEIRVETIFLYSS